MTNPILILSYYKVYFYCGHLYHVFYHCGKITQIVMSVLEHLIVVWPLYSFYILPTWPSSIQMPSIPSGHIKSDVQARQAKCLANVGKWYMLQGWVDILYKFYSQVIGVWTNYSNLPKVVKTEIVIYQAKVILTWRWLLYKYIVIAWGIGLSICLSVSPG